MRLYYEGIEQINDENATADFVRIDVTDFNDNQRQQVIDDIKAQFINQSYIIQEHYCYHDEGNKPCTAITIFVSNV